MRKLVIGFSKATPGFKPYSWIIRALWMTEYSHTYIKFFSRKYDMPLIYQASSTMLNFMSEEVFDSHSITTSEFELEVEDEVYHKLMVYALRNAGKPYGIMQAIGVGLVRIAKLLGFKIKNPFKNGRNNWICSELAGFALLQIFKDLKLDLDEVSPRDIEKILTTRCIETKRS